MPEGNKPPSREQVEKRLRAAAEAASKFAISSTAPGWQERWRDGVAALRHAPNKRAEALLLFGASADRLAEFVDYIATHGSPVECEAGAQLLWHIVDFVTGDYENGKWNYPRMQSGQDYLSRVVYKAPDNDEDPEGRCSPVE